MTISFAGHSCVTESIRVREIVKEKIRSNISSSERTTCFLGGYGDFDEICASACRELKREGENIELVFVTPYITIGEQEKIKTLQRAGLYDNSVYPPLERTPKKFAILKRNEWMMTNADVVIVYVNHTFGGAYKTLQVAKRKKKEIINICDFL